MHDDPTTRAGLGTLLRRLLELLDGDVQAVYDEEGMDYRPRYTSVVRALVRHGELPLGELARAAASSQPAVSQTVAQMAKVGLVTRRRGRDGRERIVALSERGRDLLPALERRWAATDAAAATLDRELPVALSEVVAAAIERLERLPFKERIRAEERGLKEGAE